MTLSDALVIARKRGRAVKRRSYTYDSRVLIAWEEMWQKKKRWDGGRLVESPQPEEWSPTLTDLLATDWETCRP